MSWKSGCAEKDSDSGMKRSEFCLQCLWTKKRTYYNASCQIHFCLYLSIHNIRDKILLKALSRLCIISRNSFIIHYWKTLLKRSVKCNERLRKWRFFRFFRFHGLILLMLYSPFGKEIKINRAIKSKDNISVLFLYIWLFLIIADICMWKVHSVVQGCFFFSSLPLGT